MLDLSLTRLINLINHITRIRLYLSCDVKIMFVVAFFLCEHVNILPNVRDVVKSYKNLQTTIGWSILIHGVITLLDAMPYDFVPFGPSVHPYTMARCICINLFDIYHEISVASHSSKIDSYLKIPCLHYFHSYSCFNMLEFSTNHTMPQYPSIGWWFKTNLNSIKIFVLKNIFDQYLQIAKIAMSPSNFSRYLVYLSSESKGESHISPKILFVPFKIIPETAI